MHRRQDRPEARASAAWRPLPPTGGQVPLAPASTAGLELAANVATRWPDHPPVFCQQIKHKVNDFLRIIPAGFSLSLLKKSVFALQAKTIIKRKKVKKDDTVLNYYFLTRTVCLCSECFNSLYKKNSFLLKPPKFAECYYLFSPNYLLLFFICFRLICFLGFYPKVGCRRSDMEQILGRIERPVPCYPVKRSTLRSD